MNAKALLLAALLVASVGAHAAKRNPNAEPEDLMFARDPNNNIVVLTDAKLGCTGIKQAYYVLGAGGEIMGTGCYYAYGEAVFGQDLQGKAHRWPLAGFKQTEYATKNRIGIPTARD